MLTLVSIITKSLHSSVCKITSHNRSYAEIYALKAVLVDPTFSWQCRSIWNVIKLINRVGVGALVAFGNGNNAQSFRREYRNVFRIYSPGFGGLTIWWLILNNGADLWTSGRQKLPNSLFYYLDSGGHNFPNYFIFWFPTICFQAISSTESLHSWDLFEWNLASASKFIAKFTISIQIPILTKWLEFLKFRISKTCKVWYVITIYWKLS